MGSEKTNKMGNTVWRWVDEELDLTEAEAKTTSTQQGVCKPRCIVLFTDYNEVYSPLNMLRNKG